MSLQSSLWPEVFTVGVTTTVPDPLMPLRPQHGKDQMLALSCEGQVSHSSQ